MNHINYVLVVFDDSAMGLKNQNYDVYIIVVCDLVPSLHDNKMQPLFS